ncbi:MAG: hypothetical protein ACLR7D_08330 [Lachnospira eligens]
MPQTSCLADSIEKYEAGRYKCGANIIGNIKGDNGLDRAQESCAGCLMRIKNLML